MIAPHAQGYVLRITIGREDRTFVDTTVTVTAGNDLHAVQVGHQVAGTLAGALLPLGVAEAAPVSVAIEGYGQQRVPWRRSDPPASN